MFLAFKVIKKTRFRRLSEIDIDSGKRELDLPAILTEERAEQAKWPMWKKMWKRIIPTRDIALIPSALANWQVNERWPSSANNPHSRRHPQPCDELMIESTSAQPCQVGSYSRSCEAAEQGIKRDMRSCNISPSLFVQPSFLLRWLTHAFIRLC